MKEPYITIDTVCILEGSVLQAIVFPEYYFQVRGKERDTRLLCGKIAKLLDFLCKFQESFSKIRSMF